jgi:hypothetical protein
MNLAMHEEPQQLRIRTELLQGSMMRRFSSSVGVTRTGPGACRLTMDLYMQPNVPVPFGIRHMVGHQVRLMLNRADASSSRLAATDWQTTGGWEGWGRCEPASKHLQHTNPDDSVGIQIC